MIFINKLNLCIYHNYLGSSGFEDSDSTPHYYLAGQHSINNLIPNTCWRQSSLNQLKGPSPYPAPDLPKFIRTILSMFQLIVSTLYVLKFFLL